MADIRMMSAFGTVPGDAQEGILRVLRHALEIIAQEDHSFTRAKAVFTESDEQCVFTVELDDEEHRSGRVVEFDDTEKIFTNPSDSRTEAYVTGKVG